MNLYQNSVWNKDYKVIAHEKDNIYRIHKVLYINNTTNFHGTEPTDELITLSDDEFKSFKLIEISTQFKDYIPVSDSNLKYFLSNP